MNAFCLVWMLSICKSCKVQNQAIKKDCTLHYLYISLGHSENIRHIIFGITDIMPFRKSTNSLYILPSPGNCPTSQLISPPRCWFGSLRSWRESCASGTRVPTLLAAPPPKQYSTPTLFPPATHAGYWFGFTARFLGVVEVSLRASSPIWVSEVSLARTRERAVKAHFACPKRRDCSQAMSNSISSQSQTDATVKPIWIKNLDLRIILKIQGIYLNLQVIS